MQDFLTNFPFNKISIFVTIIVSFTYNVLLDRDVGCTCKEETSDCNIYMGLPAGIIFFLILWTDKTFQRISRFTCYTCSRCGAKCCGFSGVFVRHIVKATLVGLLWVTSVYIDGDWYVCCENDHSEKQSQLACKDKNNITAEERVIITELKNKSRRFGFGGLFVIVCVAFLLSCGWRKCCNKCCKRCSDCCDKCCNSCCDRGIVYEKILLEEGETVQKEILRKAAKEQLTKVIFEKISGDDWKQCLDAADEMINNSVKPELTTQQQQQRKVWREEDGQQRQGNNGGNGGNGGNNDGGSNGGDGGNGGNNDGGNNSGDGGNGGNNDGGNNSGNGGNEGNNDGGSNGGDGGNGGNNDGGNNGGDGGNGGNNDGGSNGGNGGNNDRANNGGNRGNGGNNDRGNNGVTTGETTVVMG